MRTVTPVTLIRAKALMVLIVLCGMGITVLLAESPSATGQPENASARSPSANAYADTKLTFKIIEAPHHTYCYDVFVDGRLIIHQTSVPAVSGNEGFKTRDDAIKVARLVIEKIRKGEMPPTISIEEMRGLKVIQ
jgi:Domain of unknown function (DUF4907)